MVLVGAVGVLPALPEDGVEHVDGRSADLQLHVVPRRARHRRPAAIGSGCGSPRWSASSRRPWQRSIPPTNAMSFDGSSSCRRTTNFWWWLPIRRIRWSRITSPPPCSISRVERAVGLLVQRQPGHVRAPDQPAHAHPALDRLGEQLGHRRPLVAQLLVGIAAPVGEEQVVAGVQRPHLLDQPVEVGAAVQQRLGEVPRRPPGQRRGRVAPLLRAEQPLLRCRPSHDHNPPRAGDATTGAAADVGSLWTRGPRRPEVRRILRRVRSAHEACRRADRHRQEERRRRRRRGLRHGRHHRRTARPGRPDHRRPARPRARHAAHRRRADLDGAAGHRHLHARLRGAVVHRLAGRRHHHGQPRQGPDHRRHARPAARRRSTRARS